MVLVYMEPCHTIEDTRATEEITDIAGIAAITETMADTSKLLKDLHRNNETGTEMKPEEKFRATKRLQSLH
jgi:hypothetical protein